jgi:hypothetical protein
VRGTSEPGGKSVKYFLQLTGVKRDDGSYQYRSLIHRLGGALALHKVFENEADMLITENIRNVLGLIRDGSYQWPSLELSDEQAEILGWNSDEQKQDPLDSR